MQQKYFYLLNFSIVLKTKPLPFRRRNLYWREMAESSLANRDGNSEAGEWKNRDWHKRAVPPFSLCTGSSRASAGEGTELPAGARGATATVPPPCLALGASARHLPNCQLCSAWAQEVQNPKCLWLPSNKGIIWCFLSSTQGKCCVLPRLLPCYVVH